ncbi:MAG TPA: SRPBCC family protein [Bryobacteraceae bacterium]|nr:SRPBCC family protein [Bryobacteraceae bacterium]
MNAAMRWASAAGLGAGFMYFLDPDRGRRRRAFVRDKSTSAWSQSSETAGKAWRDVSNRAQGIAAKGRHVIGRGQGNSGDQVIESRVRSRLGRAVNHPGAINVTVTDGHVQLNGAVLEHEHNAVIAAVRAVSGVTGVDDRLIRHQTAEGVPSLQEGRRMRTGEGWTPAMRAVAGAAGAGMVTWFLRSRSVPSLAAGVAGAAMLTRAVSNREVAHVAGLRDGRHMVDIQKTIHIAAPREDVYRFWSNYENFPKFMRHIREVTLQGTKDRSHWVANGPAGVPVSWDAETTEMVENRVLAWKSVPGSTIENAGVVRFEDAPDGTTRVTLRVSYHPPAGHVGHAIASLFRADPKTEMDEDLARLKTLLEEGRSSVRGRPVERGGALQQ